MYVLPLANHLRKIHRNNVKYVNSDAIFSQMCHIWLEKSPAKY